MTQSSPQFIAVYTLRSKVTAIFRTSGLPLPRPTPRLLNSIILKRWAWALSRNSGLRCGSGTASGPFCLMMSRGTGVAVPAPLQSVRTARRKALRRPGFDEKAGCATAWARGKRQIHHFRPFGGEKEIALPCRPSEALPYGFPDHAGVLHDPAKCRFLGTRLGNC